MRLIVGKVLRILYDDLVEVPTPRKKRAILYSSSTKTLAMSFDKLAWVAYDEKGKTTFELESFERPLSIDRTADQSRAVIWRDPGAGGDGGLCEDPFQ